MNFWVLNFFSESETEKKNIDINFNINLNRNLQRSEELLRREKLLSVIRGEFFCLKFYDLDVGRKIMVGGRFGMVVFAFEFVSDGVYVKKDYIHVKKDYIHVIYMTFWHKLLNNNLK